MGFPLFEATLFALGPAWTERDGERYSEAQLRGTIEGVDPADAQALAAGRHAVMADLHGENPRPDGKHPSGIFPLSRGNLWTFHIIARYSGPVSVDLGRARLRRLA